MRNPHTAIWISILPVLPLLAMPLMAAETVKVEQGQLSGTTGGSPEVRVYKGIPYAAPPVGDLRWAAPKPAGPWTGARDASKFGNACPQPPYPKESLAYREAEPMGEDCLYLNVWTAAKSASEKRPVMVWIHGGGLTRGSGSTSLSDGENFAKKGVVLVKINYRLGILGFFAHPALSAESEHKVAGNYAVLDQIAALQWVHRNIAAFGGDPNRVTIFGESAGSWSINYLTSTPLAKGLFQRAIGESGASFAPMRTLAQAEQAGSRMNASIQALRAESTDDLLKAAWGAAPIAGAIPEAPVVDGHVFPTDIYTIYLQGKQNDTPLIAGSNGDEATRLFAWPANGTAATFISQARRTYGDMADEFLKAYQASNDKEAEASHYASIRDQVFTWQMRTWVRLQTQTGKSKAYLYQFTRIPPGPDSAKYRAYHGSEVAYVFGNLAPPRPWEPLDRMLSDQMISYWVNFATTGDPNGKGLPAWPAYNAREDQALRFGDRIDIVTGLNKEGLDFFDRYYEHLRASR